MSKRKHKPFRVYREGNSSRPLEHFPSLARAVSIAEEYNRAVDGLNFHLDLSCVLRRARRLQHARREAEVFLKQMDLVKEALERSLARADARLEAKKAALRGGFLHGCKKPTGVV